MADAVEWILRVKFGIRHVIHYLDDFLILASTREKGQNILDTTLATLQRLGIEWAPEKVEGPAKILTFLGIEIDSHNKVIHLPQSKREDLEAELQQWYLSKKCTKCQLLSLIGKLSFAGKVLPAGQIFIRSLIDLATTAKTLSHWVNLSQDTRADIEWWQHVLPSWPGKSYFLTTSWQLSPEMQLFTDTAGSHGFGPAGTNGGCAGAGWSNTSRSRFQSRGKSCTLLLSWQLPGGLNGPENVCFSTVTTMR